MLYTEQENVVATEQTYSESTEMASGMEMLIILRFTFLQMGVGMMHICSPTRRVLRVVGPPPSYQLNL